MNNTMQDNADSPLSVNGRSRVIHNDATAARASRFIQVPNDQIGRVLNAGGGKDAAGALTLLAMSMLGRERNPNYSLNDRRCEVRCGIKRKGFQAYIRLLKKAEVLLDRTPSGRGYATEVWAEGGSGYVPLPVGALSDPKLAAFVLTALLRPNATTPAKIATRLGYTARGTARRLASEAVERGYLAANIGSQQQILVGRMIPGVNAGAGVTTGGYIRINTRPDQDLMPDDITVVGVTRKEVIKKRPAKKRPAQKKKKTPHCSMIGKQIIGPLADARGQSNFSKVSEEDPAEAGAGGSADSKVAGRLRMHTNPISSDWRPTMRQIEWVRHGWHATDCEIAHAAELFRDRHLAYDNWKSDWGAEWKYFWRCGYRTHRILRRLDAYDPMPAPAKPSRGQIEYQLDLASCRLQIMARHEREGFEPNAVERQAPGRVLSLRRPARGDAVMRARGTRRVGDLVRAGEPSAPALPVDAEAARPAPSLRPQRHSALDPAPQPSGASDAALAAVVEMQAIVNDFLDSAQDAIGGKTPWRANTAFKETLAA